MSLHEAVETGDVAAVQRLLAAGASVHERNASGETPLRLAHTAAVARPLLAAGAELNSTDQRGLVPLHRAAAVTHPGLLRLYLERGADPNRVANNGQSPLLTAVCFGNDCQIALLLRAGARTDVRNENGATPLNHVQGQASRVTIAFFGALEQCEQNQQYQGECRRLRQEASRIIDLVMESDRQTEAELEAATDPRAATMAMIQHNQTMSRRALELGRDLQRLAETSPLNDILRAQMEALISGRPLDATFLGQPLSATAQQRLRDLLQQAQSSANPVAPPTPAPPTPAPTPVPAPVVTSSPLFPLGSNSDKFLVLAPRVRLELAWIPAGRYLRGSPVGELGRAERGEEQREESIAAPFWIGRYPVTQAQWEAVMKTYPSKFPGSDRPLENISWELAQEFCVQASRLTGRSVRLPTEAEWEYACRAGTSTPFYFGDTLDATLANYQAQRVYGAGRPGLHRGQTTPVGKFPPNPWGLFDMHGNVWEFCSDMYGAPHRMGCWMRGGCWASPPEDCRSAARYGYSHRVANPVYGLRIVVT